jgi:hypothetical protein
VACIDEESRQSVGVRGKGETMVGIARAQGRGVGDWSWTGNNDTEGVRFMKGDVIYE